MQDRWPLWKVCCPQRDGTHRLSATRNVACSSLNWKGLCGLPRHCYFLTAMKYTSLGPFWQSQVPPLALPSEHRAALPNCSWQHTCESLVAIPKLSTQIRYSQSLKGQITSYCLQLLYFRGSMLHSQLISWLLHKCTTQHLILEDFILKRDSLANRLSSFDGCLGFLICSEAL